MPVRFHGRMLAELGAVLGMCLAAAGCQNSLVRVDATPGQVVSMARPVGGNAGPYVPPTGAWNPIQRTSNEQAEPPLASQGQPLASTPNVLPVDGQAPQQPPMDPVLNPPTPLPGPQFVEMPGPGIPMGPHGMAAPRELDKHSFPTYVIEPPDILLVQTTKGLLDQPQVRLQTPVSMDGTINLGIYGQVYVAGMTVDQARQAVAAVLALRIKDFDIKSVSLEVAAYNSKVYYVITDGGGYGEQVARFAATGNETVLDALAQIGGLPNVASKKHVWLARATPGDAAHPQIMPVDYCAITQRGSAATNYQVFPGDRIYVGSDPWVRRDTWLARRLAPINQLFGTVLLGSTTVNSLKGKTSTGAP